MNQSEELIAKYLAAYSADRSTLAQSLREHLKKVTKPTTELVADSTISVNIGYGFTEKAWDCYVAIIVYSKHINLSFPSGATLSDPNGLLKGTGSRIRHIKILELPDAKDSDVLAVIMEAKDMALSKLKDNQKYQNEVRTIVKEFAGVKRRSK